MQRAEAQDRRVSESEEQWRVREVRVGIGVAVLSALLLFYVAIEAISTLLSALVGYSDEIVREFRLCRPRIGAKRR